MTSYARANRQYVAMSEPEVWQFLDTARVMSFSFVRADGYPHVSPVWFVAMDRTLYFRTTGDKAKARLAQDSRVCCAVEDGERFTDLRGVILWGRAAVADEPDTIERYSALAAVKYAGLSSRDLRVPERWAADRAEQRQTLTAVRVERVASWDNRRLDGWTG